MKTNCFKQYVILAAGILLCGALGLQAQGFRPGGFGGGGFGGFGGGGFGGGGFGGGGFNRPTSTTGGTSQYDNNGTVGTASIQVDPVTHNIIIAADAETTRQIEQVIASLDAPEPQVLIKSAFIEVEDNKALDFGIQGNYTGANGTWGLVTGFMTNSFSIVTNVSSVNGNTVATPSLFPNVTPIQQSFNVGQGFGLPQTLAGAAGNGGMYQFLGNDFTATIQAIAQAGKAQLLSRPSILARDGQMAEIVVGQSIYLPSSVTLSAVGGTGTTVPEINGSYQNVGIQLDVTPFIGQNGLIQMVIEPQITSIDTSTPGQVIEGGSIFSSAIYAPNLNKRSANTVVITPDGQTVVIGGLISNNKSSSESKVPLLGDIPLLGNLFKFTSKANQKDELLMFITPHIIEAPAQLLSLTTHESGQTPLITNTNAIPEQEMDRFLDRLPTDTAPTAPPASHGSRFFSNP
jgi:general secretion pathway protein D